jgi:uncharacterized protein YndB with AHSA1/START domain
VWELAYAPAIGHPARLSGRDEVLHHVRRFLGAVEHFRFIDPQVYAFTDPRVMKRSRSPVSSAQSAVLLPLVVASLTLGAITQAPAQSSGQALGNFSSGIFEMDDSHTLITAREIDASVVKVWAAWHDPDKIAKWWGPEGFRSTVKELDIRAGGRFEVIMHGPDGTDYENLYTFDHVEEHKQLVYTSGGSKQFGLAPYQSVFDLEPIGSKTRVVLKARFVSADDKRKHVEEFHAIEGSRQLLQRLEEQAK